MSKLKQVLDRRNFLGTAVAGGALVLTKNLSAQQTSANDTLNVGIIGTGAQGQILLTTCAEIPGVRITALCDIWENYNLKRASQMLAGFNHEHTTYTNYKEMLDKEKNLDAVFIATPDFCHEQHVSDALSAGLNVYCETNLSNTIDGAKAIVKAANDSGKTFQVGFQRRSNPYYRYCYDHVIHETRLLGTVTAVNAQWNRPVQTDRGWPRRAPLAEPVLQQYGYESMDQFRNWNWYKKLGSGPIGEFASHQIDVVNWFLGAIPTTLLTNGGTVYYDSETHQWPDTLMGIFEYPTQKRAINVFYQTVNANSNFGYLENFMGDEGTLYTSESVGRVKVYPEPKAPDWERWVRIGILGSPQVQKEMEEEKDDAVASVKESGIPPSYDIPVESTNPIFRPHVENFCNAIRGNETVNCPGDIGLIACVIALKMNGAALGEKKVLFNAADFQV